MVWGSIPGAGIIDFLNFVNCFKSDCWGGGGGHTTISYTVKACNIKYRFQILYAKVVDTVWMATYAVCHKNETIS